MIELKQHPVLKDLIPPLTKEEYEGLKKSIQEHGIEVPIIHDKDGFVIDGWNRYLIAKGLEIEAKTVEREFVDNIEMGISLNLRRRHLSKEQRDRLIVALREKGWTQEKVAEALGVDRTTITKKEKISNVKNHNAKLIDQRRTVSPKEEKEIKEETKKEPQKKVAEKYGISKGRVSQIVKKGDEKKAEKKTPHKPSRKPTALFQLKKYWLIASVTTQSQFIKWLKERGQI